MKPRSVVPLSIKLMFATALLLLLVAVSALLFSRNTISDLSSQYADSRRAAGETEIERQATVLARNAATAAALPLAEGNYTYLESLVDTTVGQDGRVAWLLIADAETDRVVARSPSAPNAPTLADSLTARVAQASDQSLVSARDADDASQLLFGAKITAGSRVVGQLRLAFSTKELDDELAAAITTGKEHADKAQGGLLRLAAVAMLIGLLLACFQAYRVTRPLKLLADQAARIAGGDLDQRVRVGTRDEIGLLAHNFNFMAEQLGVLIEETAEKASLQREMSLARDIQESMHPPADLLTHGPFQVAGYLESADECGGDWWTVRPLDGDRLLVVVGDVTGHGLPAAMITASARGAVESLSATTADDDVSPERVLTAIDRAVSNVGSGTLAMTCFAAVIDPRAGTVRFANAGHNFPYMIDGSACGKRALRSLAATGNPLGNPDHQLFEPVERPLRPGDTVVLFTDGLVERINAEGRRFGDRRLQRLLTPDAAQKNSTAVSDLRDRIVADVSSFADAHPADDDVTVVVCRWLPTADVSQEVERRAG